MGKQTIHTVETLLAKCVPDGDCLIWTGCTDGRGQPMAKHNKKRVQAKRLLLLLQGEKPKKGWYAVSMCGNRACMNPEHVKQVTQSEKTKLAYEMGRLGRPDQLARIRMASVYKLTDLDVMEIRQSEESTRDIAARLGMNPKYLSRVRNGSARVQNNPYLQLMR